MESLSQSSTVSTIPPDILENQDEDFIDEIERVNDLFFGNVQAFEISPTETAQGTSTVVMMMTVIMISKIMWQQSL
ncbi:MAG: hypothetical protein AB2693_30885 [Candidatus Thiodiazotropha sp.]